MSVAVPESSAPVAPELFPELEQILTEGLEEAFRTYTASRIEQRAKRRGKLSVSALGGCPRRAAFLAAETEYTDDVSMYENRQANMGTMIHDAIIPVLARVFGEFADDPEAVILHHYPVLVKAFGRIIEGELDLYVQIGPYAVVVDLKTTKQWNIERVALRGAWESEEVQVDAYGVGIRQLGLPVTHVATLHLGRDDGIEKVTIRPFDSDSVQRVFERIAYILKLAEAPMFAPTTERGPAKSIVCRSCSYKTKSWGAKVVAAADEGINAIVPVDDAQAAEYARLAKEHGVLATQHSDSADYYKELLANRGVGVVKGPAGTFKIEIRPGAKKEDVYKMAAERKAQILAEEGGVVPYKRNKPSLIITPQ